ncbi:FtsK/SpoIIIE domain-containing protein [Antribacter gilvus]|uniref:FtsK/SpoIIIE domain-containing protein n=1 Tax=Antribacter gilvus TaxID=2304675 RepID=UPI000F78E606|nr:FtsK/SpoIIIE domain-containing protein [Antribacter gilvus]
MSMPNDDELREMVYGTDEPGREVEARGSGVVDLSEARRARGLDQAVGLVQPEGGALDGEVIDPAPADAGVVEVPAPRVIEMRDGDRPRQVIPDWLRSRSELVTTCRHYAARAGHTLGFHAVRLPLYGLRLAARSPIGAGRLVAVAWRWVADSESVEVRRALLATASTPDVYLRLVKDRRALVRRRGAVVVGGAGAAGLGGAVVLSSAPDVVQAGALGLVVVALGLMGRRADGRITDNSAVSAQVPMLDQGLIREALAVLGVGSLSSVGKDPAAIRFVTPIVRDGAGYRADLDLPPGATAGQVAEKRSELASGLRRPLGCVWPEGDPDAHEGRLVLYVGDKPLSQSKPVPFPLAKKGTANVFEPIPIGVDQRGRKVEVTLIFNSGIIAAIPRMGKTFTLRLLLIAAALDPRVELHVHDLRGGADLAPLAKVAHYYRSGDDPTDMAALLADLKALHAEMLRRQKVIRTQLAGDPRCPEGKVTDEIASDKSLGMHPILIAYDETQIMFEDEDKGRVFRKLVEDIVRRGPVTGIMVWLATQRPDATSIPSAISSNAGLRFALKVMTHHVNDMVLGSGMHKAGFSATTFAIKDKGIAWLAGEGEDPVIVRNHYIDAPEADTIATRARAARQATGRLTGMAAGEEPADTDQSTILDHLLAVWPGDEPKVWCDDLADALAASKPALYEGWTALNVSAALKPHGIRPGQLNRRIDGKQTNKAAIVRAHVVAELTGDDETQED